MSDVQERLFEGDLLERIEGIGRRHLPHEVVLFKSQQFADIARRAAGHVFTHLIYPKSGVDMISALPFADTIITIDNQPIFQVDTSDSMEIQSSIVVDLKARLFQGYNVSLVENNDLVAYVAELILSGVIIDSFSVIEEVQVGEVTKTTARFQLKDGRWIEHTHFAFSLPPVLLQIETDITEPLLEEERFFYGEVTSIMDNVSHPAILSKGVTYSGAFSTLYPRIRFKRGTTLISDKLGEMVVVKTLKTQDLKTQDVQGELDRLRSTLTNIDLIYILYGYGNVASMALREVID